MKTAPTLSDVTAALLGGGALSLAMGAVPAGPVDVWSLVRAALIAAAGGGGAIAGKTTLVFLGKLALSVGRQLVAAAKARKARGDELAGGVEQALGEALLETVQTSEEAGRPALPDPSKSANVPTRTNGDPP